MIGPSQHEPGEEWRSVVGYGGAYSVSSLGRVYSEPRVTPHGYWKTARGNAEDRERHGNTPRGEAIGISKLSSCDVTEIRCLHVLGATQRAIAEVFGVAQTTIGQVLRGETWRHVAS